MSVPVSSIAAGFIVWLLGRGLLFVWSGFLPGVSRVLSGGIGPGVPRIMAVADPGDNTIDSGGAWVMRVCLGRGRLY